jgi:hypothetical protein
MNAKVTRRNVIERTLSSRAFPFVVGHGLFQRRGFDGD